MLFVVVCSSLYFNYSCNKELQQTKNIALDSMMVNTDTSMQLETALQILTTQGPIEIERIAREVGREEAIKVMQEFSENLKNLTASDNEN